MPKVLNSQQQKAVEHPKGPLLIIAGAGTGKTTVITERIKWLIARGKAKPADILALTFTEKAAREMEERVDQALPYGYTDLWISTFHAFCDRVLRHEALQIGLDSGYRLLTEAETIQFLTTYLYRFDLRYFRPLGNPTKFIGGLLQHFSRLKDEDVSPREYLHWAQNQKSTRQLADKNQKDPTDLEDVNKWLELAGAYERYEELKIKEGLMDYADLITQTLRLFRERPNVLAHYRRDFKHVLVDEFQDTNIAQYALIKLLAPPSANPHLTVVGDDSQSIYKFRGAAVSNLLQFRADYPAAKQVVLTQNYRSSQNILDHAYRLIKHNDPDTLEARLGIDKNLKAVRKTERSQVEFIFADRVENEAELVVEKIKELMAPQKHPLGDTSPSGGEKHADGGFSALGPSPYAFSDFAILVRANNHAEPFVRALARHGLPYQFLGPGQLFRQPEVKDLVAYLKVLDNFEDNVAFYRVLSMDIFGLNGRDLAALVNIARQQNLSLFEAVETLVSHADKANSLSGESKNLPTEPTIVLSKRKLSEAGIEKINRLVNMIHRHQDMVPKESAGQILYYFLEDSGLLKKLTEASSAEGEKQVRNVARFFDRLKTYEVDHEDASVAAVVDWIDLSMRLGESPLAGNTDWFAENRVNLLTVHSAKGLEFPVVFLVNLVAERFPTRERREQIPLPGELIKEILPAGDFHTQEERRLFYVGLTRARDHLFLTAAKYYGEGKREKKISPFVTQTLGDQAVKQSNDQAIERAGHRQLSFLDWQKPPLAPQSSNFPGLASGKPRADKLQTPPVAYLSYSQIECFTTCPRQYRFKYLQRIPVPASAAASFGTSIHLALKDFYDPAAGRKQPTLKQLLALLAKNWKKEGYASRAQEEASRQEGERMLTAFYRREHQLTQRPLALEQVFVVKVTPALKVGGKIDRVDRVCGGLEIWDYKTGRVMDQNAVDRSLQMTVYALAATDPGLYGRPPEEVTLSFYFLDTGEKKSTKRTSGQLAQAKKDIAAKAAEISQSDFAPKPGMNCDWCDYKLLCEVWS